MTLPEMLIDLPLNSLTVISFYEWRDPARTVATLVLLAVCLLVITLAPTWLLVKSALFFAGVIFFGLFPISSRYPQYRLLASPTTWLFWKIPTHGERNRTCFKHAVTVMDMIADEQTFS